MSRIYRDVKLFYTLKIYVLKHCGKNRESGKELVPCNLIPFPNGKLLRLYLPIDEL